MSSTIAQTNKGLVSVREELATTEASQTFDYSDLVAELRYTFESGKTKDLDFRRTQLHALISMVSENVDRITEAIRADLGGPKFRGIGELLQVNDAKLCLKNLDDWAASETVKHSMTDIFGKSTVRKDPKGVILLIAPWNYPIQLVLRPLTYIIAAGNCCIIKPSELSPNCAKLVEELVTEYLDPSVCRVVQGAVPETTALLKLRYDHIVYTGNGAVAQIVMEAAAKHLTPTTLELGGKSPVIIDKTADIKKAATQVAWGKWGNAGQTCIAPDYVIVHSSVKEQFLSESKLLLRKAFGDKPETSESWGKIIHPRHVRRVEGLVSSSSGKVVYGNVDSANADSKFFPPTLVVDASLDDRLMQEEIFGPALSILSFEDLDEAISIVKQVCDSPLALYIFSESDENINKILDNTASGGVCVNDTLSHVTNANLPFGGIGASGMGYYGSKLGFDEFTHFRAVLHRGKYLTQPMFPPPDDSMYDTVVRMLVTGFVTDTQLKMLKATAAAILGFLVFRPKL